MVLLRRNGWVDKAADGRWRALTLSGVLTHHTSVWDALEAVS